MASIFPRIGVAGLNPHGGEGGLFGKEEKQVIIPAVDKAASLDWNVTGPLPPDTIFNKAVDGTFDAVVAMYHDQGLIPFKLLHFADGVNVTMGLPIVRTSVDHGTAYDIAGKGVADPAKPCRCLLDGRRYSWKPPNLDDRAWISYFFKVYKYVRTKFWKSVIIVGLEKSTPPTGNAPVISFTKSIPWKAKI